LWRHYAAPTDTGELTAALRTAVADGPALVRYVDAHLAGPTGASSRTPQRRFVGALGLAPSVVLHRLRLERAMSCAIRAADRRCRRGVRLRQPGPLRDRVPHRVRGLAERVAAPRRRDSASLTRVGRLGAAARAGYL
jgi:hypothetical protein